MAGATPTSGISEKKTGVMDLLLANPLVLLSALGIALYALSRGGYQVYFSHYDVTPEEVGLDYITLLSREAVPVAVLLVFILIALAPIWLSRRRYERDLGYERAYLLRRLADEQMERSVSRQSDIKAEFDDLDFRLRLREMGAAEPATLGRWVSAGLALTCALLLIWLIALYGSAYSSIELGKIPIAPLQVEVHPVKVSWLRADGSTVAVTGSDLRLPKRCGASPELLYLGQANSLVVLYAECAKRPVRLPRDRVYLS